jgi:hypothetical protein
MKGSVPDKTLKKLLTLVSIFPLLSFITTVYVNAAPENAPRRDKVSASASPKRRSLSPSEQQKFLATRVLGVMMGSFGAYASLLYATEDICIGTDNQDVLKAQLHTMYPAKAVYMPTHAELFDMIARQTRSSFSYIADDDHWHFHIPYLALPYMIVKAPGWTEENRNDYVSYIPSTAPVGMDIYMMGKDSGLSTAQEK